MNIAQIANLIKIAWVSNNAMYELFMYVLYKENHSGLTRFHYFNHSIRYV